MGRTKVISSSILHRHGARGPGDSETSAWEETDPVVTQWQEGECENLTKAGVKQIRHLGEWYARGVLNRIRENDEELRPFFRCSKSDRAKESGRDFITAFNETVGFQVGPRELDIA